MYHSMGLMSIWGLGVFSRTKTAEYYTFEVSKPNHFLAVTVTESVIE